MRTVSLLSLAFLVVGAPGFAQQSPEPRETPPLMVNISANGRVLVRGAKVTSVATSTVQAQTSWGPFAITWTVVTDGATEILRRQGGAGPMSEIAIGNIVSFEGTLDQSAATQPTVRAKILRNWSVEKQRINAFGVIQGVASTTQSFILNTEERGSVTVLTTAATKFTRQNATTTFAALRAGDVVSVHGLWDRGANTLQADWVKIRNEQRRTFEGGRLKTLPGAVKPTSMIVTFGRFDYTVNIAEDTSVLGRDWLPANLAGFMVGHHIRVYGAGEGTVIDATVVRDMDLPARR